MAFTQYKPTASGVFGTIQTEKLLKHDYKKILKLTKLYRLNKINHNDSRKGSSQEVYIFIWSNLCFVNS